MTMLMEKKLSRKVSAQHRLSAIMESLEERQLFSLLGIGAELGLPATSILGAGAGAVNYNASTHAFTITGAPVSMIIDNLGTTVPVSAPSGFTINLSVDNSGNAVSGANPSTDVSLSGTVTIGSSTYSGVLLTGQIEAFGFQNDPSDAAGAKVDNFEFQFHVTGGQLAAPQFAGQDIGVVLADENSNFVDFNTSFSATPVKGYVGSVPASGSAPIVITGHKYQDITGNGLSADDTPLAGVTIQLINSSNVVVATQVTDANGLYVFRGVAAGTYTVKEVVTSGWIETGPASGSYTVVATSGIYSGLDFDNYKMTGCNCMCGCGSTPTLTTATSSLSGTVFVDCNNNGKLDYNESGIGGVKITLTGTNLLGANVTLTTTTDSNGHYTFSKLIAGNYTITETQPSNYNDGAETVGSLGGTAANDVISNITVPPCATGCNYNFGEAKISTVCGNTGHSGCKVTFTGCDQYGRQITYCTITDSCGNYCFTNVCDGNYSVSECNNYGKSTGYCKNTSVNWCNQGGTCRVDAPPSSSYGSCISQLLNWLGCW